MLGCVVAHCRAAHMSKGILITNLMAAKPMKEMVAVGRFLPVKTCPCAGHIRCKWLVKSNANRWSSGMQTLGQVRCNFPE